MTIHGIVAKLVLVAGHSHCHLSHSTYCNRTHSLREETTLQPIALKINNMEANMFGICVVVQLNVDMMNINISNYNKVNKGQ